jgi:GT2 family glycosyltransferase
MMSYMQLKTKTNISVIVPTLNRVDVILDTLSDIRVQRFRDYEVIVIDQSDEPNSEVADYLSDFHVPTRYCHVTHFRGLPQARNYGLSLARGNVIVYIDDDIRCGPDFLQAHVEAHHQTGAAMVAGGITEAKGDVTKRGATGSFIYWTATPIRNYHLNKEGWCLHAPGGNFSVRRSVLDSLGGFDDYLSIGAALYEETDFGLRLQKAGYRCWFAPKAHLTHLAAPMGGCRVGPNVQRYVFGMAHNRAILIFRHLKPWHRPTAILRMLLYGISYSRDDRSIMPFCSALQGLVAGFQHSTFLRSAFLQPTIHNHQ